MSKLFISNGTRNNNYDIQNCLKVYIQGTERAGTTILASARGTLTQRQLTLRSAKFDASNRLVEPSRTNAAKFRDIALYVLGPHS